MPDITEKISAGNRIAVFASYSSDDKISEYIIYYLENLKKVCGTIIFCADNDLGKPELNKLNKFCKFIIYGKHGEYDFGSYKRGLELISQKKFQYKQLILCNDSCYGPISPLEKVFDDMQNRKCDFWGITSDTEEKILYLHSYFLVFNKKVIRSGKLEEYLNRVKQQKNHKDVCRMYEYPLTGYLNSCGFTYDCYIRYNISSKALSEQLSYPYSLIKNNNLPFIKIKVWTDISYQLRELPSACLFHIRRINQKLYKIITDDLKEKDIPFYSVSWNKKQRIRCRNFTFLQKLFFLHKYYDSVLIIICGIRIQLSGKNKIFLKIKKLGNNFRIWNRKRNLRFRKLKADTGKLLLDYKNKNIFSKNSLASVKRVIFLRNDDKIGDMIISTVSFRELKKALPEARIGVITGPNAKQIIENNKNVDDIFIYKKKWREIIKLGLNLRRIKVDLYIDMDKSPTLETTVLLRLIRPRFAFGFNKNNFRAYNINRDFDFASHVTDWHNEMLKSLGLSLSNTNYEVIIPEPICKRADCFINSLPVTKKTVVLNLFAASHHKNISFEQTYTIAKKLTNFNIILLGEKKKLNDLIKNRIFPNNVFISRKYFSLLDSLAFVARSSLTITTDTCIVHAANAFNKNIIAFYKANNADKESWIPTSNNSRIIKMPDEFSAAQPDKLAECVKKYADELLAG